MNIGKQIRLKSLYRFNNSKLFIVPMDHCVSIGVIEGLDDLEKTIRKLSILPIDAIVLHKGMIIRYKDIIADLKLPVIMHLSAGTSLGIQNSKKIIGKVSEAVSLGCSGVSIHINFGDIYENDMLKDLGNVSRKCHKMGMPLLAMVYHKNLDSITISHMARVCAELGADLIKISYPKLDNDIRKIIDSCPVPILISGGEYNENINEHIKSAVLNGIGGVAIGRNIFQSSQINIIVNDISEILKNS